MAQAYHCRRKGTCKGLESADWVKSESAELASRRRETMYVLALQFRNSPDSKGCRHFSTTWRTCGILRVMFSTSTKRPHVLCSKVVLRLRSGQRTLFPFYVGATRFSIPVIGRNQYTKAVTKLKPTLFFCVPTAYRPSRWRIRRRTVKSVRQCVAQAKLPKTL
jgi:hypothetical protein